MRRFLFVLSVPLFLSSASSSSQPHRTVFVQAVEKSFVDTFLNRFATDSGHVVVTEAPVVDGALAIRQPDGHDLFLIEPKGAMAVLPGELARVEGLIVAAVPKGIHPHGFFQNHDLFAERVSDTPTSVPTSATPELPGLSQEDAAFRVDIDPDYLEAKIRQLSGADPIVIDGQTYVIGERGSVEGRELARRWLAQEFTALGFNVSEHVYDGRRGVNIIAEKSGADPDRFLIVSAHYDSVSNAGADDDGTGVITALATAHAVRDAEIGFNLRIAGFDQEELGLIGSRAYARSLNQSGALDQLVGVINLEMTAYDADNDGAYHAIHCNENTSRALSQRVSSVVARDAIALQLVAACTNRSDHASFWRYDKPAIVVSQNFFGGDSNPCYHRSCDRVDRLHFGYMTKLTTAVARTVAGVLGARERR